MLKATTFFLVVLAGALIVQGEKTASEFSSPWRDGATAIAIDAYADNDINWDKMAADRRVVAVIHKATEGLVGDSKYAERKQEALRRGYLWGSYHVGRPGDPMDQADHYLKTTAPGTDELLALDLEAIGADFMSLDNARRFIERLFKATGRYPILYLNHVSAKQISSIADADSVFRRCPLWYARYRQDIPDFPKGAWSSYTLWQFSSEINCRAKGKCLYDVPGTRHDMDVNVFYGTPETLRARWPLTGVPPQ